MARYEIATEAHGDRTIVVAKIIGQADGDTLARLSRELSPMAERGDLRVLLDEADLRAGIVLPQDVRGIVDEWRSLLVRPNVRIAALATNPIVYGLNRVGLAIVARDTAGRVAVFSKRDEAVAWLIRE
jgi:hypothetical protein